MTQGISVTESKLINPVRDTVIADKKPTIIEQSNIEGQKPLESVKEEVKKYENLPGVIGQSKVDAERSLESVKKQAENFEPKPEVFEQSKV